MKSEFRTQIQTGLARRAIEMDIKTSADASHFGRTESNGASEIQLENVLLALESWDGEDVGEMAEHFFFIDSVDEVKRWYFQPALQDMADRVGELRKSLVSSQGSLGRKFPRLNLRGWSPILEGRNGSTLWFSPAFGIYTVTEETESDSVGLAHDSDGGHSYYAYVKKVVLSHDD